MRAINRCRTVLRLTASAPIQMTGGALPYALLLLGVLAHPFQLATYSHAVQSHEPPPAPFQVNLLLLAGGKRLEPPGVVESTGQFVPLYPVQGSEGDELDSVGFHWVVGKTSTLITSYAADGSVRWNVSVPHKATSNVTIGGGFDFDSDGIPDLSMVYHSIAVPASSCGRYPMGQSDLALMRGATGEFVALSGLLPKNEQADLCWDFREPSNPVQTKQCNETHHCVYPTQQWTAAESPIWGSGTPVLIFSPTYSQWLYQLKWNPSTRQMENHGKLKFPSCPLDSKHLGCADASTPEPYEAYNRAQPNAFYAMGETSALCAASPRNWTKCTINPHCAYAVDVAHFDT